MALHKIGEARQAVYDALAPLLDAGRVSAYPADQDVGVQVWIDVPTVGANRGSSAIKIEVDFPVHVTYDGADTAQVAGLDDLVSRIWDACELDAGTTPISVRVGADLNIAGGVRRRQIVTVRRTINARTLCAPDAPGASPIPPDKTQQE